MNLPDRWEYGSEFHFVRESAERPTSMPWGDAHVLTGSGRDALRSLILLGMAERGWTSLWVPSYFCQEVVSGVVATGIAVRTYHFGPLDSALPAGVSDLRRGDALLVPNFFGMRSGIDLNGAGDTGVEVIEDHTHDPFSGWAHRSTADWCIASLRKTLPIPDGGVLWSPRGHDLPPLTEDRKTASGRKLLSMFLKEAYLDGGPITKNAFRELAIAGEDQMASGEASAMLDWSRDLLSGFPIDDWRSRRRANHGTMSQMLADLDWAQVLRPDPGDGVCPFSAVLITDSHDRREHIRRQLIASGVYPAVLWSLDEPVVDGIPPEHVDLSRRMLSIHCDMRYNCPDITHVCSLVSRFGNQIALRACRSSEQV